MHRSFIITYMRMIKRILTLAIFASLALYAPLAATASENIEIIEQISQATEISVAGNVLHITGAAGQDLYIYNVTGIRVKSIRIDSNDKRYELNLPKGCYIVKVGKVVRKISIR